jgi:hypothetical protein
MVVFQIIVPCTSIPRAKDEHAASIFIIEDRGGMFFRSDGVQANDFTT